MPIVDSIESKIVKDAETGAEVTNWFLVKNPQFRHLNLCLNQLDEFAVPALQQALTVTPDEFCFTLSGNPMAEENVEELEKFVKNLH